MLWTSVKWAAVLTPIEQSARRGNLPSILRNRLHSHAHEAAGANSRSDWILNRDLQRPIAATFRRANRGGCIRPSGQVGTRLQLGAWL